MTDFFNRTPEIKVFSQSYHFYSRPFVIFHCYLEVKEQNAWPWDLTFQTRSSGASLCCSNLFWRSEDVNGLKSLLDYFSCLLQQCISFSIQTLADLVSSFKRGLQINRTVFNQLYTVVSFRNHIALLAPSSCPNYTTFKEDAHCYVWRVIWPPLPFINRSVQRGGINTSGSWVWQLNRKELE